MPSNIGIQYGVGKYLQLIDWVLFICVLVATVLAIVIGKRFYSSKNKDKSIVDYILMGRALTTPLFVITLVTSWYGSIFGVTQIAYSYGIYNFVTQGLLWYIAYIFFAFTVAKKINYSKVLTMPEKIKKFYGGRSGKLSAFLIIVKGLPVSYAIGIGLVLRNIFGFSIDTGMILGCCFVMFYCSLGGLRAVVFSEIVQFFVMFIAVISVLIVSYLNFGGISFLQSKLPDSYFQISGTRGVSDVFIWLFIAFSSTIVCPIFYQRCLAAASPKVAFRGILISTLFWCVFDISTTLGAMYAKAVQPDLNSVDAYLLYAVDILPYGLKGIFLAGVVATILSTLDAFTFVIGNIISYDLMPMKWRGSVAARNISIFIIGGITMIISILSKGNLEEIWLTIEGYSGALLIMPIIWGYIPRMKGEDKQFITSCIISLCAMILYDFLGDNEIRSFYIGAITSVCMLGLFQLQSYLRFGKRY